MYTKECIIRIAIFIIVLTEISLLISIQFKHEYVDMCIIGITICRMLGILMLIMAIYMMLNNILEKVDKSDKKWNGFFYANDEEIEKVICRYNDKDISKVRKQRIKSSIKVRCRFYKCMYMLLITTGIGAVVFDKMGNVDSAMIEMIYPIFIIISVACGNLFKQMYIDFVLLDVINSECNE